MSVSPAELLHERVSVCVCACVSVHMCKGSRVCTAQLPVASLLTHSALLSAACPGHLPLQAPGRRAVGWASGHTQTTGGAVVHREMPCQASYYAE